MMGAEERSAGGGMRRWRAPIREAGRCDELGPVRHGTAAGKRVYALLLGRGEEEEEAGTVCEVIKMMSSQKHAVFDRTGPCKSPQTLLMPSVSRVIAA